MNDDAGGVSAHERPVGRPAPERAGLAAMIATMERQAFEAWWDRWCAAQSATLTEYDFKVAEAAWLARGAHQKPCRGVEHHGCNYLAPCGGVCNKCGQAT